MPQLSVIVPVYNECTTIRQILERILLVPVDKEVVVVDDGSTDGTDRILREVSDPAIIVIHHTTNRGKGAAVQTGISHATGEFIVVQDADLEYDPGEYQKLITPLLNGSADMVLGVRFTKEYRGLLVHQWGNRFLTGMVNALFGSSLNDCFTCFKMLRRSTALDLRLRSPGFEVEIEFVTKAIRRGLRIVEVPVVYRPRQYREGKKIRIRDGLWALGSIFVARCRRQ